MFREDLAASVPNKPPILNLSQNIPTGYWAAPIILRKRAVSCLEAA